MKLIRATNFASLPNSAINDTKITRENTWSAEKINVNLGELSNAVGKTVTNPSENDFNNYKTNGRYTFGNWSRYSNVPFDDGSNGTMLVEDTGGYKTQIAINRVSGAVKTRLFADDAWTTWKELATMSALDNKADKSELVQKPITKGTEWTGTLEGLGDNVDVCINGGNATDKPTGCSVYGHYSSIKSGAGKYCEYVDFTNKKKYFKYWIGASTNTTGWQELATKDYVKSGAFRIATTANTPITVDSSKILSGSLPDTSKYCTFTAMSFSQTVDGEISIIMDSSKIRVYPKQTNSGVNICWIQVG